MSYIKVPSVNEEVLHQTKALYLGTTIFKPDSKTQSLSLSQLQEPISQRYPVDGSNFVRAIQTTLSIYPSGIQMEHSSLRGPTAVSALFFYPIKSLIYCGALRFVTLNDDSQPWAFVPIDSHLAHLDKNSKNPALFVTLFRGIDSRTKTSVLECHVFIIDRSKTGFDLIESCQKAFSNKSSLRISEFLKIYSNVPALFCMKDDIGENCNYNMMVKKLDLNGYYYSTKFTPMYFWKFMEQNENLSVSKKSLLTKQKTDQDRENKTESKMDHIPRIVMRKLRTQSPIMTDRKVLRVSVKGSEIRFESPPRSIKIAKTPTSCDEDNRSISPQQCYEFNRTTRIRPVKRTQLVKKSQVVKSLEMSTKTESNASTPTIRRIILNCEQRKILVKNPNSDDSKRLDNVSIELNKSPEKNEQPTISSPISEKTVSKQILELIRSAKKTYQLKSTPISRENVVVNKDSTKYRSLIAKDYSYRFMNFEINM